MAAAAVALLASPASADSIADQWRSGLAGARLTSYSGSVVSANSTLTVIRFCRDGRYVYEREGSWSEPGTAAGASRSKITGRWQVVEIPMGVLLGYATDEGEQGTFPMYLQSDGKVNIGGAAYAAERGAAGC
jgi:hypothetical protein